MRRQPEKHVRIVSMNGIAVGNATLRLVTVSEDPEPWWWSGFISRPEFDPSRLEKGSSVSVYFTNGERVDATILDILPWSGTGVQSAGEAFLVALGALPSALRQ